MNLSPYSQNIVSNSAEYLLEILEREINKNHDPESCILAKIIMVVYDFRAYEPHQDQAMENFMQDALEMGITEDAIAMYDGVER